MVSIVRLPIVNNADTVSEETKIFLMGQVNCLIMTAKKLRLEATKATIMSGELKDRATEILCVVSNLLTMLTEATRREVKGLMGHFEEAEFYSSN